MKLKDELKNKVDAVKTLEEKKAIIAKRGIELTDEEMYAVVGGIVDGKDYAPEIYEVKEDDWN